MERSRARALILLLALWAPALAHADPPVRVREAERLFDEANAAMAQDNLAVACSKYEQSQRLDPQLGTELHLADCYERQQKLASAWLHYRAAAQLAAERNAQGLNEPREAVANRRAQGLAPRLSTLQVSVQVLLPGMQLSLDGLELPPRVWGVAKPVDGGSHEVRTTAPGRVPWSQTLTIAASAEHASLIVPPLPTQPADAQVAEQVPASAPPESEQPPGVSPVRVASYVVAGAGIVAGGIGVAFAIATALKVSKRNALCPMDDVCADQAELDKEQALDRQAQRTSHLANGFFVAGGVALTAGVALFLFGPSGSERASQPAVGLSASARAGAVTVSGRF